MDAENINHQRRVRRRGMKAGRGKVKQGARQRADPISKISASRTAPLMVAEGGGGEANSR